MYVYIFNKVTSVPIGDLEEPGFVGETGCTKKGGRKIQFDLSSLESFPVEKVGTRNTRKQI